MFEPAVVNEEPVFEPLKLYCAQKWHAFFSVPTLNYITNHSDEEKVQMSVTSGKVMKTRTRKGRVLLFFCIGQIQEFSPT